MWIWSKEKNDEEVGDGDGRTKLLLYMCKFVYICNLFVRHVRLLLGKKYGEVEERFLYNIELQYGLYSNSSDVISYLQRYHHHHISQ